jgi:hypothetical protein
MSDSTEYEFVVPFVIVKSQGGPFDDSAFVAGVITGALYQELETCAVMKAIPRARYIHTLLLPQVDLIAMRHGYQLRYEDLDEASGYQHISFDLADDKPQEAP